MLQLVGLELRKFDPTLHPHAPGGAPGGIGGQFVHSPGHYSLKRLIETYGEIIDERDLDDGITLRLTDHHEMHIIAETVEPGQFEVVVDGIEPESARHVADLIDSMREKSEEFVDSEEQAIALGEGGIIERLVDYDFTADGSWMVGYNESGDMRFAFVGDEDPLDVDPNEAFDLGVEEAARFAESLRELADFVPEQVDSVSAGPVDVYLFSDHQILLSDDGAESWLLPEMNRREAVQLHQALWQAAAGQKVSGLPYWLRMDVAEDGSVALTTTGGESLTVESEDIDPLRDALKDVIDQIRHE